LQKNGSRSCLYELNQAREGYKEVVAAAGGDPTKRSIIVNRKLPELVKTQVEAVKNIKIDKITVWDQVTMATTDRIDS
jgi:flotillin